MNLEDRATTASAALSARARLIGPHRRGLERKSWVVPVGAAGALTAILLVALAISGLVSDGSTEVEVGTGVDESAGLVGSLRGPIVAGFVSPSGEITVLTGDPASLTAERLGASAGPPVLGVETIPEPRWSFDGRVIEYVSEADGDLKVVRVDVRTGKTTTEPYWVVLMADGGISTSLEDQGSLMGSIALIRGAAGPSVTAIEDETGSHWRLRTFDSDRSQLFSIGSTRFLAPTPDGLIVVVDGALNTISADGKLSDVELDGVAGETVNTAAAGPFGQTAFGLTNGSVVVTTLEETESFDLDRYGAVTGLSWDPSGEAFIAQTTNRDHPSLHVCVIASTTCTKIEAANDASGRLVRGTPTPLQPEMFTGFWPESTQTAADSAASADDAEPWRFDPELLTTQFAEVVLGWPDPVIAIIDQVPLFPYWASFEVRPSRQQPSITITAAQLAGETGGSSLASLHQLNRCAADTQLKGRSQSVSTAKAPRPWTSPSASAKRSIHKAPTISTKSTSSLKNPSSRPATSSSCSKTTMAQCSRPTPETSATLHSSPPPGDRSPQAHHTPGRRTHTTRPHAERAATRTLPRPQRPDPIRHS